MTNRWRVGTTPATPEELDQIRKLLDERKERTTS